MKYLRSTGTALILMGTLAIFSGCSQTTSALQDSDEDVQLVNPDLEKDEDVKLIDPRDGEKDEDIELIDPRSEKAEDVELVKPED